MAVYSQGVQYRRAYTGGRRRSGLFFGGKNRLVRPLETTLSIQGLTVGNVVYLPTLEDQIAIQTTVALDGALAGTLMGTAELGDLPDIESSVDLDGALVGTLATAPLLDLQSSLALAGSLAGTLGATPRLGSAPDLESDVAFGGELEGTLAATAEVPLLSDVAFVGTLGGTLAAQPSLAGLPDLESTLALVGTLDGALAATAEVPLPNTVAFDGALVGSLLAEQRLGDIPDLESTLALDGELEGTLAATAEVPLLSDVAFVGTLGGTLAAQPALEVLLAGPVTVTMDSWQFWNNNFQEIVLGAVIRPTSDTSRIRVNINPRINGSNLSVRTSTNLWGIFGGTSGSFQFNLNSPQLSPTLIKNVSGNFNISRQQRIDLSGRDMFDSVADAQAIFDHNGAGSSIRVQLGITRANANILIFRQNGIGWRMTLTEIPAE